MKSTLHKLEQDVERLTGRSAKELRDKTIGEIRVEVEVHGIPLRLQSESPTVGRGNVLKDRVVSRKDINKMVDKAFK
jgi:hypothetical protein